jgi:lipopolysaccharide transport system permease protein
VTYRDIQYLVPFLIQLWFFATPVVYPAHLVHEPLRTILGLNPMAGVVEGFRWALLRAPAPPVGLMALSSVIALALLVSGAFYFRRTERIFADVV